jgi:hypothetical protein
MQLILSISKPGFEPAGLENWRSLDATNTANLQCLYNDVGAASSKTEY